MKRMNKTAVKLVSIALLFIMAVATFIKAEATVSVFSTVFSENTAPIAKKLEYQTYKGIEFVGFFSAVDPEGDLITFEIASEPKKGVIEVFEDGSFKYTPFDGKKGKDTFTYVAIDSGGNVSEEASVKIDIKKQSTSITYSDMKNHDSHYAALSLAENDIFIGECISGEYFFRPEETFSRGELLVMCLKMCDAATIDGITRTGFSDDEDIASWLKPYVSTALMSGVISGYSSGDGTPVFMPDKPVTFAEAAVILNGVIGISDVVSVSSIAPETAPAWAYQATANLYSCSILPTSAIDKYDLEMTRAEVSEMLLAAINVINNRDNSTSLLNWAR